MAWMAASLVLGVFPNAFANYSESFESGTFDGWNAGILNGSLGTVNGDRASDGTFSFGNLFTVPASFSGWTMNNLLDRDARTFLNSGATTMSLDVYSDWANPNGWGVYGNAINLVLNYEGGWTSVSPTSGGLVNGSFQTLSFDLTSYAATITNPGLSYSSVSISWFVGTWAGGGDGLPNGTQTFAIDKILVTQPVPEPGSAALLGLGLSAFAVFRRRTS